jgi:phospholipid-transporting ATPase
MSDEADGYARHRIVYVNDYIKNEQSKFIHNGVTTAKYQIWNFLFKFLYEQFSKYANVFFLFIAIIQVHALSLS